MNKVKTGIVGAIFAMGCLAGAPASAKVWNFSFTDTASDVASGQFTTNDTGPNFSISAVTGQLDGSQITSISGFAAADNVLYTGQTVPFSFQGISFEAANGNSYNLFNDGSALGKLINSSFDPVGYGNQPGDSNLTSLRISAVPEPMAWALMILGLGGVGTALRRSKRSALAATPVA